MADFFNRLISAVVIVFLCLLTGYMCGAPIIERDASNFPAYLIAGALGGLALFRPWRYA